MWLETQTTTCWVIEHASSADTWMVKDDPRIEILYNGLAIYQAIMRHILLRRPCFDPRAVYMEFVVDNAALGQGFLRELRFSLPIVIKLTAYHMPTCL